MVQTQRAVRAAPAAQETTERAEHRLVIGLRTVAGVLFVATGVYVLAPVLGLAEDFFREPPFVSNSAVKVALIALACLYAAGDVRGAAAGSWWPSSRRTSCSSSQSG